MFCAEVIVCSIYKPLADVHPEQDNLQMSIDLSVYDIGDLGLADDSYDNDYDYDNNDYYGDEDSYYYDHVESEDDATSCSDSLFSYGDLVSTVDSDDLAMSEEDKYWNNVPYPFNKYRDSPVYDLNTDTLAHARALLTVKSGVEGNFMEYMKSIHMSNEDIANSTEDNVSLECEVKINALLPCEVNRIKNGHFTKQERRAMFKEFRDIKKRQRVANLGLKVPDLFENNNIKGKPGEPIGIVAGDDGVT
jgi:hypothetical protein